MSRTLPDIRGDGIRNWETSAFKQFQVTEAATLQFRAELFNLSNTPPFGMPAMAVNVVNFDPISGQANSPRQVQFGLKLPF
ncbi:MAG: hypothetical protein FJW31_17915 [Acidobacteria bacterium]|nr:hypothetical protein [Acidobacteriota bacterium]